MVDCVVAYNVTSLILNKGGVWHFIGLLLFVVILAAVLMILSTCWMHEFHELLGMCRSILSGIKGKLRKSK